MDLTRLRTHARDTLHRCPARLDTGADDDRPAHRHPARQCPLVGRAHGRPRLAARIKTADLYQQGWNDAITTANDAWKDR